LLKAGEALHKTHWDLLKTNRDAFKFRYNNRDYDLLAGFDAIVEPSDPKSTFIAT
jgi:hypothetical protein